MIKGRNIIIYLSLKYEGDWEKILGAIKRRDDINYEEAEEAIGALKCKTVTIIDPDYPENLKNIFRPPFVLYYYGDLSILDNKCLAVIGSREAGPYGIKMTRRIIPELCRHGICIVSGLAKGIDLEAHNATIGAKGKTVAVLGNGIDYCYPKENIGTYETIRKEHLLISEYPHEVKPEKHFFPWRNRLIAGLSHGVFVVEAKKQSGTSITVNHALQQGKDIFVLPHPADDDNSTNRLIKDGAILVERPEDITEELMPNSGEEESDDKNLYLKN